MKTKFSLEKCLIRIGNAGRIFYLVGVLALVQALFAAFAYITTINHNQNMLMVFRILSVVFFIMGLFVLGWNAFDSNASFKSCIFTSLFVSIPSAFFIFAVKGFFMFVVAASLNPETSIATNFFNYRDIAIYFLPSFVLLLATGAVKHCIKRKINSTTNQ